MQLTVNTKARPGYTIIIERQYGLFISKNNRSFIQKKNREKITTFAIL